MRIAAEAELSGPVSSGWYIPIWDTLWCYRSLAYFRARGNQAFSPQRAQRYTEEDQGQITRSPDHPIPRLPSVSVLIAARNEEKHIEQKIRETLAWDYPPQSLEVLIASDASDDRTDEIAQSLAGPRMKFVRMAARVGEDTCLESSGHPGHR